MIEPCVAHYYRAQLIALRRATRHSKATRTAVRPAYRGAVFNPLRGRAKMRRTSDRACGSENEEGDREREREGMTKGEREKDVTNFRGINSLRNT